MKVELFESATLQEQEAEGRKWLVKLISSNVQGSSGYYSEETLKRDGPKVFTAGIPIHVDHQTTGERQERPFGSVSTLVGEFAEDAYYDPQGPEGPGLYGIAEIFEDSVAFVRSRAKRIGLSIRALGRKVGNEFVELFEAKSVDLVMKAGAGGKFVAAVESAVSTEQEETLELEKILEAIESLKTDIDGLGEKFEALEAQTKVVEDEGDTAEETAVSVDVAKQLALSGLSEAGIDRVYELHKATGADVDGLIKKEKEYLATESAAAQESVVVEDAENEGDEAEESAKELNLTPSFWKDK